MNAGDGLTSLGRRFDSLAESISSRLRRADEAENVLRLALRELCPEHAEEICSAFGVGAPGALHNDLERVRELTGVEHTLSPLRLLRRIGDALTGEHTKLARRVVRAALVLIAAWHLERGPALVPALCENGSTLGRATNAPTEDDPGVIRAAPPCAEPVVLSLVVPASAAAGLVTGGAVELSRLLALISDATYFGTAQRGEADCEELQLGLSELVAGPDQDVYLRVDLDDGTHLLEVSTKYGLKKVLSDRRCGTVTRLSALVHHNSSDFLKRA